MQELHLEELLPACWLNELRESIESSPNAAEILGVDRDPTIVPSRRNTFKCLQRAHPLAVNVVIIADAPFPTPEKATGIACFDGSRSWNDNLSPTLRYVVKSALVSKSHCKRDDGIAAVRAALRRLHIASPQEWFDQTMDEGVLWLNASLTRTPEAASVETHAKFWKPVIGDIIRTIAVAKARRPDRHRDAALCVALWGSRAKSLANHIRHRCQGISYRIVTNQYPPSAQSFLDRDNFREIDVACEDLRIATVTWVQDSDYVRQLVRRRLRDGEAIEEDEPPARRRRAGQHRLQLALFYPPPEEAATDQEACIVCMVNKINTVILNCAHVAVCCVCATMLQDCPICRAEIHKIVRTFSAR